jgi:predicted ATPase
VWVDESTRLLTSGAITYSDAGSHELKGKAEPMPLWAVRAVVAAVGGSQRADGLEAPLTGRGRELRVIKELFHDVQENSRPALVVVSGDPGLGKTRLAWEFEKYIDGLYDSVAWHSTRCLAYGDGVAYWPIAEAVRGRLGLVESDQDSDPGSALDVWLAENDTDEEETSWMRPRIMALLGGGTNNTFDSEDLFSAWRTFLERAGGSDPVSLVIDDAQHADDGTMRFVEHILANSDAPLFVMLLARGGLLQRWPDLATNRRATVLHLASLEAREMSALLDGLVSGMPPHVRDGLVDRAQGVPLYAIETVRSLIDRDLVVPRGGVYVLSDGASLDIDTIGAPASLQAVVAARLDQLTPTERRVVADASVFGLTFSRDALAALAPDVGDLDDVLMRLTRTEIFGTVTSRLSAEYGQFRFVQDVVRQVAYNTQSRRDRKAKHLAVAAYLSAQADPGDVAPVLAQHYLDAVEASGPADTDLDELRQRALEELRRAGNRAVALGAWVDARRYFESAMAQAQDDATRAPLHIDLARVWHESGDAHAHEAHAREPNA